MVLSNLIIAYVCSIYNHTNELAAQMWLLVKAKQIQQFMLSHEKSPLTMLPAPLNMITAMFYPIHHIYTWRARLYINKGVTHCVSCAGTAADWVLKFLFLLPCIFIEYWRFIGDETFPTEERYSALLMMPFELVTVTCSILYKVFFVDDYFVNVLLKTRLAQGRLRVQYGDSRDHAEVIGVDDNVSMLGKYKSPTHSWNDDGGIGNKGAMHNPRYAKVGPMGTEAKEGEELFMGDGEGLGDQSNIWATSLEGMVNRQALTKNAATGEYTANIGPLDNQTEEDNSALGALALGGEFNATASATSANRPLSLHGLNTGNTVGPPGAPAGTYGAGDNGDVNPEGTCITCVI